MIILPSYIGIIINHYKDPYKPSSIMESRRVFFFISPLSITTPHSKIKLCKLVAFFAPLAPFSEVVLLNWGNSGGLAYILWSHDRLNYNSPTHRINGNSIFTHMNG